MLPVSEALSFVTFTKEEKDIVAKYEAVIDSKFRTEFNGAPMRLEFDEVIPLKLSVAIQRKYELGGWKVGIAPGPKSCAFSFIPGVVPTVAAPSEAKYLPDLKVLTLSEVGNRRLLVRMPTRGRPAQALSVLAKYREMAGVPVTIEVVLDEDDETMLQSQVLQRLNALGCVITVGAHKTKIEAVNGGRVNDWDILLLASDDMVPVVNGYGVKVLKAMEEHFPFLDGAIYFDDGSQHDKCCTLPIFGRHLYDQFGYVYHPDYKSLFCDQEQTEILTAMGRLSYVDEKIIEHRHPAWGMAKTDAIYTKNNLWDEDKRTYELRKRLVRPHSQFGFNFSPLWLSICIATLPKRRVQLERLVDHLYAQVNDTPTDESTSCEIVIDNRENISIGLKRQALLEKAKGHFVAFVDDDDWVPHDYVERILSKLSLDVDCLSLKGIITTAGEVPEGIDQSIKNTDWEKKSGVHCREPNHLNPVRRSLALKAGFTDLKYGEDRDYSKRLYPLLKNEVSTGDEPLYFYWYNPGKGGTGK